MDAIALRPIQSSDNPAVAALIRQVMTEFGAVGRGFSIEDPEVDAMYEAYQQPGAAFDVLVAGERLVGCGGIGPLQGGDLQTCELKKMYFLPEIRGQGWGRRLLELQIDRARAWGYRWMYLETLARMEGANRLYRKLGFQPLSRNWGATGHCGCDHFYALDLQTGRTSSR